MKFEYMSFDDKLLLGGRRMGEENHTDMYLANEIEQHIQVKDARYTLDEFNRIGELLLGRNLTDDQQEVLEWLQIYADKDSGDKPFQTIFFLWDCIKSNNLGNDELTALRKLTRAEQFQVLAAFAEWGISGD